MQTTSTNENLSLQQLEIQCNNYAQTIEKLNIEIDVLKSEILGKNDEISSIQNQYSQLGISYQTKLAEMEQNSQMSVEENILQLQSEINRLNQVLIEKENFIQEAHSVIQQHLNRANVSTIRSRSQTTLTSFCPCVDIFYLVNVDKY